MLFTLLQLQHQQGVSMVQPPRHFPARWLKKTGLSNPIFPCQKLLTLQVVPGRAGGGSFRRKKNYIAKKEFAYRMCARRPTSAMPKPCLCCERAFCCSMVVMWPVLMQCDVMWRAPMWFDAMWLLVLCHVTWCNAMSCDVRSRVELSSVVPCNGMEPKMPFCEVTLCVRSGDSKYYSVLQSTTLYYKVLLQYYSVLQSSTGVLLQY